MADAAVFVNTAQPAPSASPDAVAVVANPAIRSGSSTTALPRFERMRACYGGTDTMRQMGRIMLPQHPREGDARYFHRLEVTACTNKVREAVDSASAKPFRNLLRLKGGDSQVQDFAWNADAARGHLHLLAHKHFNEAVLMGLSHFLVDMPTEGNFANLAEYRAANPRPFFRLIKPENLLSEIHERIGGEKICVHARFSSSRIAFNRSTFTEQVIDQVWVVEPFLVQLYERPRPMMSQLPEFLAPGGGTKTTQPIGMRYYPYPVTGEAGEPFRLVREEMHDMDRVPLVTMTAGDEEAQGLVRPIFQDLAFKQIEHWQSTSEQRSILSYGRFPMLAVSGVQLDEDGENGQPGFEVGPGKILVAPDAQGRWYYVEPEGHAIKAGADDIAAIEIQMDMMALNPVQTTNRQYVPQNERSIAETRVNSVIHDLALSCKDSIERGLGFAGMWLKQDWSKVSCHLNMNLSGTDELAKKIADTLNSVKAGVLSRRGALEELQRLNQLDDEFDIEAELLRDTAMAEQTTQETISVQAAADAKAAAQPPKADRDFPGGKTRPT